MPLFCEETKVSSLEQLQSLQCTTDVCASFVAKSTEKVDTFCLYLGQGEYSAVPFDSPFKWIGSAGATSCHILVLFDEHKVCLSHIDRPSYVKSTVKHFEDHLSVGQRHACVVGGVIEPKNDSKSISEELFTVLSESKYPYTVNLWCTLNHNTTQDGNGISKPHVTDVAFDMLKRELVPAKFSHRGPEMPLRTILYHNNSTYSNPYHEESIQIRIPHFEFSASPDVIRAANLPAELILRYCSTTPSCEPDYFVQDMRDMFHFQATKSSMDVFGEDREPIVYELDETGLWQLVSNTS